MIAAALDRILRFLLAITMANSGLRRTARSLVRKVPVFRRLTSTLVGMAQTDMIAAAGERTPLRLDAGPAPGFADRERLLATARAIIARRGAEAAKSSTLEEGSG